MSFDRDDFRVPGATFDLGEWSEQWPTKVKPLYKSKKHYKHMLAEHVEELSTLQRLHYASNRYALLLIFQAMDAAGRVDLDALPSTLRKADLVARARVRRGARNPTVRPVHRRRSASDDWVGPGSALGSRRMVVRSQRKGPRLTSANRCRRSMPAATGEPAVGCASGLVVAVGLMRPAASA